MRILITGATGFIGSRLINELQKENHNISIITRDKNKVRQSFLKVYDHFDEIPSGSFFDAIINLAGAPISKRWTTRYKETLIASRINATRGLYDLIKRLEKPPRTLISASAIGYYGSQDDKELTESAVASDGFTHDLCKSWEQEALRVRDFATNVIIIRLGVVLGKDGGMLKETVPIFKMCLGGKIGTGKQYLSWIHMTDVVNAIKFLLSAEHKPGVYNLTAPFPVRGSQWTAALSKALNRPAFVHLPSFIVKIVFGQMGKALLLEGQKVIPKKLLDAGFVFKYEKLSAALVDILHSR